MKSVIIRNISLRTHGSAGKSHIEFYDKNGNRRLGRIIPSGLPVEYLSGIYSEFNDAASIITPDGITKMPDGTCCLSIKKSNLSAPAKEQSLRGLIKPLRMLHEKGICHLSIDKNCFQIRDNESEISLVFWGDGLLFIHPDSPCEVQSGGIPCPVSDLFMASAAALRSGWLCNPSDISKANSLCSNNYKKRLETAAHLGYPEYSSLESLPVLPSAGVSIIQGGTWQNRDMMVNSLSSTASVKGWACRIIRCASGEKRRPLPDTIPGIRTGNPSELLQNAFAGTGGIEKLLVIHDFEEDQKDLAAILRNLARIVPSGLRLVICGASVPSDFPGNRIQLQEPVTVASDIPLYSLPDNTTAAHTGPSWYGPRCRISRESAEGIELPVISSETLFTEGAWRSIANGEQHETDDMKAESFYNLGRYQEALQFVSANNNNLRARSLMGLGRFDEAINTLKMEGNTLLLAEAYLGQGNIQSALNTIRGATDPLALPLLAKLHDLSGTPASAIGALENALKPAEGKNKVNICCALRNLEMRLGLYESALEHCETAVNLARDLASVPLLVKSLQERGRTLQVSGNWKKALEDYRTAVHFHENSALSSGRPPHIDLFILELKMGLIKAADITWKRLKIHLKKDGVLSRQMILMLEACRGVLLGSGEEALPMALKAAELAETHGLELYRGLSTLYAGELYIQTGDTTRGINLLKQARSAGHILGDRHLVCLADIELAVNRTHSSLSSEDIGIMAAALPEEHAALQIISGTDTEAGFQYLLDLPSPLLACRLAVSCGLPGSPDSRKEIIRFAENIRNQIGVEKTEHYKYNSVFKQEWDNPANTEMTTKEISGILSTVSRWIQNRLEGNSTLSGLAENLGLNEISLTESGGMTRVPGDNPLFCSGVNAETMAPALGPVAAVLASTPVRQTPVKTEDMLSEMIIGNSRVMKKIKFELTRVAGEDIPVLISGETGTGKELCARAIHILSRESSKNFVPVDCGAIPENLMESEFFGAASGAYTGMGSPRKGLLEEADGGILFLDEIGNLPIHMQAKLLRVLDTGTFRRLGETRQRTTRIKLIAATNADIEKQAASGEFRSDLYYRISVVRIHLPPLRNRLEDLPLLAARFTSKSISTATLALLESHRWPGNIRELSNVLKRASIASTGNIIQRNHITFNNFASDAENTCTLHEAIRIHMKKTVESLGGNRKKAAEVLQCDPKTLRKYLTEKVM